MKSSELTPSTAAYRLTHVLNAVAAAHGIDRFPIDVTALAMECANIFRWADPIASVQSASIKNFEGALVPDEERTHWLLLYNDKLPSKGRVRFTQAHELGHYALHRDTHGEFRCTVDDVGGVAEGIEEQADKFAATLLMPLDDFRAQVAEEVDFNLLGACADRYGVSLTAATLRWLEHTTTPALLVVHRDGFIRWAKSSQAAMSQGAFFRTKRAVISVPDGTLATNSSVSLEKHGTKIPAQAWFPHASADGFVTEMKISADAYDWVMTLLVLPRGMSAWPPDG